MSARRGGLGRGLGALIPTTAAGAGPAGAAETVRGARYATVPVTAIEPNPRQPRDDFDEEAMAELVTSIREVGLLQPVVVRPLGGERYQLVMGERRWRAAREAGLGEVPAIVRETDDDHMLRDALLENLHRQQLNPLEEAAAYEQLLGEFGTTHEELATRIGRSRSQVTNTLRLLRLPPAVQRRVAAGVLSAGHARALLALEDPEAQERLATRIVAEGLSVRAVEEMVSVGDVPAAPRARRGAAARRSLDGVAAALAGRYETRVKVEVGRSKGKLVVEFGSIEDLQRILDVMAPGVAAEVPTGGDEPLDRDEPIDS